MDDVWVYDLNLSPTGGKVAIERQFSEILYGRNVCHLPSWGMCICFVYVRCLGDYRLKSIALLPQLAHNLLSLGAGGNGQIARADVQIPLRKGNFNGVAT